MLELAYTGTVPTPLPQAKRELPPLILHPLAGYGNALAGRGEVRRMELRMLCCLGMDLNRWLEQCVECAAADPSLHGLGEASFIGLLVDDPPEGVTGKLQAWGVGEFRSIFARSLGLNAVFPQLPAPEEMGEALVRDFPIYADALYRARRHAQPAAAISKLSFTFEVFAAGEYSRMLEKSWGL